MKMLLLLLSIVLFQFQFSKACSCSGEAAFCDINFANPTQYVFIGKVLQHDSSSSQFEIIERLRGVELRDTITIWDYIDTLTPGIGCSTIDAFSIGAVGDSILIILGKITDTSYLNPQVVVGDYYAPSRFCAEPTIPIKNGFIMGNITKAIVYTSPPTPLVIDSISITDFKTNYKPNAVDCDLLLDLPRFENEVTFSVSPNPFSNQLNIESSMSFKRLRIYNILGELVIDNLSSSVGQIDVSALEPGTYFVTAELKSGEQISKKIIKN